MLKKKRVFISAENCNLHKVQRNTRKNKHLRSDFVESMVNVALETRLISIEEESRDPVDCKLMSKTFRLLISEAVCSG